MKKINIGDMVYDIKDKKGAIICEEYQLGIAHLINDENSNLVVVPKDEVFKLAEKHKKVK